MGHFMRRLRDGYQQEAVWVSLKKENFSMLFEDDLVLFRITFIPSTPHFINKTIVEVDNTYQYGPWVISLTRVPLSEFNDNDLSLWEILRNCQVFYYLEETDNYHIDSDARPKPFRLYPKQITLAMPLIVSKTWNPNANPTTCVKVTLKFTGNEVIPELERLKQRSDEKKMCSQFIPKPDKKLKIPHPTHLPTAKAPTPQDEADHAESLYNFLNE